MATKFWKTRLLLSVVISIGLLMVNGFAGEQKNLVKNPGGEEGSEWWSTYENNPIEYGGTDKESHSGKKCMYLKLTDAAASDGYFNSALVTGKFERNGKDLYEVKPNTKYYYSFWLKGKGFTSRPLNLRTWGFDKEGKNKNKEGIKVKEEPSLKECAVKSEWTQYKGYFVTGEKTERLGFLFLCYGKLGQIEKEAVIYIDDVYIGEQESTTVATENQTIKKSATIKCPKCNTENTPENKFCGCCGAKIK